MCGKRLRGLRPCSLCPVAAAPRGGGALDGAPSSPHPEQGCHQHGLSIFREGPSLGSLGPALGEGDRSPRASRMFPHSLGAGSRMTFHDGGSWLRGVCGALTPVGQDKLQAWSPLLCRPGVSPPCGVPFPTALVLLGPPAPSSLSSQRPHSSHPGPPSPVPQCVWNSDPLPAPVLGPAPREHLLCPSLSFSHFPVPASFPLLVAPFHRSSCGTFSVTPAAASWCSDPVRPSAASTASPGCLAAHPCWARDSARSPVLEGLCTGTWVSAGPRPVAPPPAVVASVSPSVSSRVGECRTLGRPRETVHQRALPGPSAQPS